MRRNTGFIWLSVLGLALLCADLLLVAVIKEPQGMMRALPYVLIGLGCGVFGHGMGELLAGRAMKKNPGMEKQMEIEKNDERNITVRNRAKAKAYDRMVYIFGALMLAFALLGVDVIASLLLVAAYLFVIGYELYYQIKYDKEM